MHAIAGESSSSARFGGPRRLDGVAVARASPWPRRTRDGEAPLDDFEDADQHKNQKEIGDKHEVIISRTFVASLQICLET